MLYKSFVRCHIEYANSVWNPPTSGLMRDIERVQKRATKYVQGCKHMSYIERLKYLNLPTLRYRRLRGDMIEVYKILHNIYYPQIVPALTRNMDSRTRGNALKLAVQRSKLDIRKYYFCNRIVRHWNSLPDYVVDSVSLNSFKINVDRHYKQHEIYFDFEKDL